MGAPKFAGIDQSAFHANPVKMSRPTCLQPDSMSLNPKP